MKKAYTAIKSAVDDSWLSVIFAFLWFVGKGLIAITSLLSKILYPIGFVLNAIGFLEAINKTYQDIRDWFLIKKRAVVPMREFGLFRQQRKARAEELVGPWNIIRNSITNVSTIALKLSATIACGLMFAVSLGAIISPWIVPVLFATSFGLGTVLCAIKAIDSIYQFTQKGSNKKAATAQLIFLSLMGAACLTACAAVVVGLLIPALTLGGGVFGPALIFGAVATGLMAAFAVATYAVVKWIKHSGEKKAGKQEAAPLLGNSSPETNSSSFGIVSALKENKLSAFIKLKFQTTFDNGLFYQKNGEYTRDSAYEDFQRSLNSSSVCLVSSTIQ